MVHYNRGIDKYRRVIWRLKEQEKEYYIKAEVENAIMHEVGTDYRTLKQTIKHLKQLGWIRISSKRYFITYDDYL